MSHIMVAPRNDENTPGFVAQSTVSVKKGTPNGDNAKFNQLPPDPTNIEGQEVADTIGPMPLKTVTPIGYP